MHTTDHQQKIIDFYGLLQGQTGPCLDRTLTVPSEFGAGHLRALCPRKGMLLVLENYQLSRDLCIDLGNMPLPLGFTFCISGRIKWTISGVKRQFCTETGQCEMLFTSQASGKSQYDAGQAVRLINIMLSPALLQSYLDQPLDRAGDVDLLHAPSMGQNPVHRVGVIPGASDHLLRRLLRAPCHCISDSLLIQGLVMELVAFQLGLLGWTECAKSTPRRAADGAVVGRAKQILHDRMDNPPSLTRLARMVGASETKLKRCFASLCGTTVYGYLSACRMERACELLADHNLTMAHIAAELGYAERTHFTRAFARHFGLPPSEFRSRLASGLGQPASRLRGQPL